MILQALILLQIFNGPTDLSMKFYDDLTVNGPAKLHLVKTTSLVVNGPLEFHSLSVAKEAAVTGPMKGDYGKFGTLRLNGSMETDHVVAGALTVMGPVKASYIEVTGDADIQ